MGETFEDLEKKIELKDNKSNFFLLKKGNLYSKTSKRKGDNKLTHLSKFFLAQTQEDNSSKKLNKILKKNLNAEEKTITKKR